MLYLEGKIIRFHGPRRVLYSFLTSRRQIKGMEELIRQAFLHIEAIGPHVAEGRYDLVGPNGDIILPQVWETVIEPDWTITMHMWPIPEKPKPSEPDPPPADASKPQSGAGSGAAGGGAKKKPEQTGVF